jgi:hypothetical protein
MLELINFFKKIMKYVLRIFYNPLIDLYLYRTKNIESIFTAIYKTNRWGDPESISGSGSTLIFTEKIRNELPKIIEIYSIKSILDAPCGDLNWMSQVLQGINIKYIGGDIVLPLIEKNKKKFKNTNLDFIHIDITRDYLPEVDLMIVRDTLFHLSQHDIERFFYNFKNSKINYLLTTSHLNNQNGINFSNTDISTGDYRLLDLFSAPYNFSRNYLYEFDDYLAPESPRKMFLFTRCQIVESLQKFQ